LDQNKKNYKQTKTKQTKNKQTNTHTHTHTKTNQNKKHEHKQTIKQTHKEQYDDYNSFVEFLPMGILTWAGSTVGYSDG
jgi:hypothetical protein